MQETSLEESGAHMGKHSRGKASVGALVVVAAGFVAVQVATGAISNAVTEGWDFAKDKLGQGDPPVEFIIEADRSKLGVPPSQWTIPLGSTLPSFTNGSCEHLDEVASQLEGAVAMDPVIRVTAIGRSAEDQAIIRSIYPKVVEETQMPPFAILSCPIGGPLPATTAQLAFADPRGTTYYDDQQQQIANFNYALAEGEPGVIYAQRFAAAEAGLVHWDLMVEYSLGGEDYVIDINEQNGLDSFVTSNPCGATASLEWLDTWADSGPYTC